MNNTITPEQQIQRTDTFIEAPIDGELVLMSIDNGKYYGMDSVASRIWGLLEQPTSLNSIVATLVEEYDVSQTICESETLKFIELLATEKALII
jgi:hypothetical protein